MEYTVPFFNIGEADAYWVFDCKQFLIVSSQFIVLRISKRQYWKRKFSTKKLVKNVASYYFLRKWTPIHRYFDSDSFPFWSKFTRKDNKLRWCAWLARKVQCQTRKTYIVCPRDYPFFGIMETQLRAPVKCLNRIVPRLSQSFRETLNWSPMMPRDASSWTDTRLITVVFLVWVQCKIYLGRWK